MKLKMWTDGFGWVKCIFSHGDGVRKCTLHFPKLNLAMEKEVFEFSTLVGFSNKNKFSDYSVNILNKTD